MNGTAIPDTTPEQEGLSESLEDEPERVLTSDSRLLPVRIDGLWGFIGTQWRFDYNPADIFEPWYNLNLGIRYLRELADRQPEVDWVRVLSEYNFGPDGLERVFQRTGSHETGYSCRVMARMQFWEAAYENPQSNSVQD